MIKLPSLIISYISFIYLNRCSLPKKLRHLIGVVCGFKAGSKLLSEINGAYLKESRDAQNSKNAIKTFMSSLFHIFM